MFDAIVHEKIYTISHLMDIQPKQYNELFQGTASASQPLNQALVDYSSTLRNDFAMRGNSEITYLSIVNSSIPGCIARETYSQSYAEQLLRFTRERILGDLMSYSSPDINISTEIPVEYTL